MKDSTFESKAYGKRVNKIISIEGRVQFDLLQVHVHVSILVPSLLRGTVLGMCQSSGSSRCHNCSAKFLSD